MTKIIFIYYMIFESNSSNYEKCPFDERFLIWKNYSNHLYELCLKDTLDEDGFPKRIGYISPGDEGKLKNASNLGWRISEDFRNQGIMSKFLNLYLEEICPQENGFAVVILKSNTPSYRLAIKAGFTLYDEDDQMFYLKRK